MNMVAIGNKELAELPYSIREEATCPKCWKQHKIQYGEEIMPDGSKIQSTTLGYVKCNGKSYLVSIQNKLLRIK